MDCSFIVFHVVDMITLERFEKDLLLLKCIHLIVHVKYYKSKCVYFKLVKIYYWSLKFTYSTLVVPDVSNEHFWSIRFKK